MPPGMPGHTEKCELMFLHVGEHVSNPVRTNNEEIRVEHQEITGAHVLHGFVQRRSMMVAFRTWFRRIKLDTRYYQCVPTPYGIGARSLKLCVINDDPSSRMTGIQKIGQSA